LWLGRAAVAMVRPNEQAAQPGFLYGIFNITFLTFSIFPSLFVY
jgi:hypothetical protein